MAMDMTALKSFNIPNRFYFPSKLSPFRHFTSFQPRCSLSNFSSLFLPYISFLFLLFQLTCVTDGSTKIISRQGTLPRGAGEALPVNEASRSKILQVVLVSPQIPGNTGCIARTCAASAVGLHLVGPLGFQVDDTKLKRAGLDYWPYVVVKVHDSWEDFRDYFRQQDGEKRLLAFTKRGTNIHSIHENTGILKWKNNNTAQLPLGGTCCCTSSLLICINWEPSLYAIQIPRTCKIKQK